MFNINNIYAFFFKNIIYSLQQKTTTALVVFSGAGNGDYSRELAIYLRVQTKFA